MYTFLLPKIIIIGILSTSIAFSSSHIYYIISYTIIIYYSTCCGQKLLHKKNNTTVIYCLNAYNNNFISTQSTNSIFISIGVNRVFNASRIQSLDN